MENGDKQTSNDPRKQIGQAIWLLLLLLRFTPGEWTGEHSAWVAGGNVVSDAELAERLRVCACHVR